MTFDLQEKSGGEPGEFYHVSDVKGREVYCVWAHPTTMCKPPPHFEGRKLTCCVIEHAGLETGVHVTAEA